MVCKKGEIECQVLHVRSCEHSQRPMALCLEVVFLMRRVGWI
jgi:hypothetical protein